MNGGTATIDAPATPLSRGTPRLLVAISLALHLLVFAWLLVARPPKLSQDAAVRSVEVELVTLPPRVGVRPAGRAPSPPVAPSSEGRGAAPSAAATPAFPEGLVVAKRLRSAAVLADPRSRPAREALRRLVDDERIRQLCGFEAMEQIRAADDGAPPEQVIADALGAASLAGSVIEAKGAAVYAGGRWRKLAFRCEVTASGDAVARFAFRVGPEIGAAERRRHDLPLGGDLD